MSFSKVNPELRKKIKELSMSFTDKPQPELLIPIPNPSPDIEYKITVISPEFTSLCPVTPTQPDYATVAIEYYPKDRIIELKSLKFYLVSYRTVEIFHEAVIGNILKDLVNTCGPKKMKITCDFTVRGGIHTVIEANYNGEALG